MTFSLREYSRAGLGRRVKYQREALGLSLDLLARSVGINAPLLRQIEVANAEPTLLTLVSLATALGTSTDWLLRGGQ